MIDLTLDEEDEILFIKEKVGFSNGRQGPYFLFRRWDRIVERLAGGDGITASDRIGMTKDSVDWDIQYRSYLEVFRIEASPPLRAKIAEFLAPRDEKFKRSSRVVSKPIVPEIDAFPEPNWWLYRRPLRYTGEYLEACAETPLVVVKRGTHLIEGLRRDVTMLAETIGERHLGRPEQLAAAADWIKCSLSELGFGLLTSTLGFWTEGGVADNIELSINRRFGDENILVIGAHYDTVPGSPGADDNASAVAALLAIARELKDCHPPCQIRLVFFSNAERPHYQTDTMGSLVYARECRARGDKIRGMIALESLGYYSTEPIRNAVPEPNLGQLIGRGGQRLALVGNDPSEPFFWELWKAISITSSIDCARGRVMQADGTDKMIPEDCPGVGGSDHWSFWQAGYPAVMATDMAAFFNPHHHTATDVGSTLCYPELAEVTIALADAIKLLAAWT